MDVEALHLRLSHLISSINAFDEDGWNTDEGRRWLGQASALVEAVGSAGNYVDTVTFNSASEHLGGSLHNQSVQKILAILYRCHAQAEISAPSTSTGSFIPVGEAFSAVHRVVGAASTSVMMIDPFSEANLLTKFAVLAPEGVQVFVLSAVNKPSLKPAMENWISQFGPKRPLEVRMATPKSLHDRLIIVDRKQVWDIGQSFNKLASRSHTSLGRSDDETARMKIEAYDDI